MHLEASDLVGSFGPFFLVDQVSLDLSIATSRGWKVPTDEVVNTCHQSTDRTHLPGGCCGDANPRVEDGFLPAESLATSQGVPPPDTGSPFSP